MGEAVAILAIASGAAVSLGTVGATAWREGVQRRWQSREERGTARRRAGAWGLTPHRVYCDELANWSDGAAARLGDVSEMERDGHATRGVAWRSIE
ncbi:MAG TPA: hypothetical protein VK538_11915 [Solirubrobacteraceae bacterium]|nr:hypothetical protein [Solirubrobacteraceae bacterium]